MFTNATLLTGLVSVARLHYLTFSAHYVCASRCNGVHTINLIIDSSSFISGAVSSIAKKGNFCKGNSLYHPVQNNYKYQRKKPGWHKETAVGKSPWRLPFRNVVLLLLPVVLLTGCPTHAKKVLVIGDSISYATSGQLSMEGDKVEEISTSNRMVFMTLASPGMGAYATKDDGSEYWNPLLSNVIDNGEFDAIVVQLGTNDCVHVISNPGDYLPYINHIVDGIRAADSSVPILWLTMQEVPGYIGCSDIINNDLVASGVQTLPYGQWATARPECFADGIHPRDTWRNDVATGGTGKTAPAGYCNGKKVYASWLKVQLDTFFGPTVN